MLMCTYDWYMVPRQIRARVNQTWRDFLATQETGDIKRVIEARRVYESAVEAAKEGVRSATTKALDLTAN